MHPSNPTYVIQPGNVVKYVWRNGLKDSGGDDIQDLKKAQWYLNKEMERLEATAAYQ